MVALNEHDQVVIGYDAIAYVNQGNGIREVNRNMESGTQVVLGNRSYRPEQISALILKKLKMEAEYMYDMAINDIVLK